MTADIDPRQMSLLSRLPLYGLVTPELAGAAREILVVITLTWGGT
jgi:hypothetical protein